MKYSVQVHIFFSLKNNCLIVRFIAQINGVLMFDHAGLLSKKLQKNCFVIFNYKHLFTSIMSLRKKCKLF